jgi:hypothetical protein
MSDIAATATHPPGTRLQVGLILLSAVQLLGGLVDLPNAFTDYGHETALLKAAQAITSVYLVLTPILAAAALAFAVLRHFARAIYALAALIFAEWLSDLPSIAIHGTEITPDFSGLVPFGAYVVMPILGVAAIVLTRRGRLGLATLAAALPTLAHWAGVIAFTIGIMVYGF